MKIIIISGPSGSGKTTLSKKISEKIKNSIVLSTDDYYKTGKISKFLSKVISNYFDKRISFNYRLLKKDINFILDNGFSNHRYTYDFSNKKIKKSEVMTTPISYLIIEGIFATELLKMVPIQKNLIIELKTKKFICMNRVINRDIQYRGKSKENAESDFLRSWNCYYSKNKSSIEKAYEIEFSNKNDLNFIVDKIITLII